MKRTGKFVTAVIAAVFVSIATPFVAIAAAGPSDMPAWMMPWYQEQLKTIHAIFPYTNGKLDLNGNFTRYQAMFAFAKVQQEIDALQNKVSTVNSSDSATIALASNIMRSTGQMQVTQADGTQVVGSAFFVEDNQHILTDMHVIDEKANAIFGWHQPQSITFVLGNDTYTATVVNEAVRRDLALLKLNKPVPGAVPLQIAKADPAVGESTIAVGSPLGMYDSVTKGIVSRVWEDPNRVVWNIQVDSALNPGDSGGPLVDYSGNVIGIVDWSPLYDPGNGVPTIPDGMGQATSWKEIQAFLSGKDDNLPPSY